jgi:hypothetical protein
MYGMSTTQAEYHVAVEHHPSRAEPRGWTVSICGPKGLIQIVARDRTEKDARDMAEPIVLAFQAGARECGDRAMWASRTMIGEVS